MNTYVFGVFETPQSQEPIETVVLGINCTVTAHALLDKLLGADMPKTGNVRLMQSLVSEPRTCFDWITSVCQLCVPYFTAMQNDWPEDEWHTLTPDLDLQLVSDYDSANNELRTAYIYPVNRDTGQTNGLRSFVVWSDVHKALSDFIKGDF